MLLPTTTSIEYKLSILDHSPSAKDKLETEWETKKHPVSWVARVKIFSFDEKGDRMEHTNHANQ